MFLRKIAFVIFILIVNSCGFCVTYNENAEKYFHEEETKVYQGLHYCFECDAQSNPSNFKESLCLGSIFGDQYKPEGFFLHLNQNDLDLYLRKLEFFSRYSRFKAMEYVILSLTMLRRMDECKHLVDLMYQLIKEADFVQTSENLFYNTYGSTLLIASSLNKKITDVPPSIINAQNEAAKIIENEEQLEKSYKDGDYKGKISDEEESFHNTKGELTAADQKWHRSREEKHKKIESVINSICEPLGLHTGLTRIWLKNQHRMVRKAIHDYNSQLSHIRNSKPITKAPSTMTMLSRLRFEKLAANSKPPVLGANADYVFYLNTGGRACSIPLGSRSELYEKTNSLCFPMNTNPLNHQYIGRLSLSDQALLDTDELGVVLREIKKTNPTIDIKVVPIPRSMYQLSIFLLFLEEMPTYEEYQNLKSTSNEELRRKDIQWNNLYSFSDEWSEFYKEKLDGGERGNIMCKASKAYIESPEIQDLFWRVNDRIIRLLNDYQVDFGNFAQNECAKVAHNLVTEIVNIINKINHSGSHWRHWDTGRIQFLHLRYSTTKAKQVEDLMEWCIKQEYTIMNDPSMAGKCRIYRGCHKGTGYSNRGFSSSFGGGFFSAIIYSLGGDMPFEIALKKGSISYIDIDKKLYRSNPDYGVFTPPIPALGSACGRGELHHPRTKVLNSEIKDRNTTLEGIHSENLRESNLRKSGGKPEDLPWLITKDAAGLREVLNSIKVLDKSFLLK